MKSEVGRKGRGVNPRGRINSRSLESGPTSLESSVGLQLAPPELQGVIRWSSVLESGNPAPEFSAVGRWSSARSSLESGRASSELRVLALWSSVFSIPDSSDFALESSGSSLESGLESRDFGPESGDQSAGVR